MTAIGYIRVSSEDQADSGLGLEAQRQRIEAYCHAKGIALTRIHEDAGVSGGKPLASRPAGKALMAEARKKKAVVIVAKFDRLFRSVADAAVTIQDFDRQGVQLVAIAEGFDMTNLYGRAMAQMASVFAELERGMIRERTKAAMAVKRGRHERISRHAPYGWDFSSDGLVEVLEEQGALQTMREWREQGQSFQEIAERLNRAGVRAKQGGDWGATSVRSVLKRAA